MALIRTLKISTAMFERMKEKFYGFRVSLKENKPDRVNPNSNNIHYYVRKNEGKILWFSADWTLKPGQTMQPFHTTTQHLLRRKSLNRSTTLLRYVACRCLLLWEVCSQSKRFNNKCCTTEHFFCFQRCCVLFTWGCSSRQFDSSKFLEFARQLSLAKCLAPLTTPHKNNMQQMVTKCCVFLGKKFQSFDRGL